MYFRKFLKTLPYIKCDLEYGVPVVAVLGTIFSLWAADFFLLSVKKMLYFDFGDDFFAIYSFDNTSIILAILTACLLYFGFKYDNAQYIQNWCYYKLIECILVFIGCIIFCSSTRTISYNWPYLIIGPLIIACGYYLILNVKRESKEIVNNLKNEEDCDNKKTVKEDQLENVIDAETNAHFDSIIRHWGYVKFFEAVVICPSLLLVVVQKYGDSYNYALIVYTVIGICLLIVINIWFYLGNLLKCFTQKDTAHQPKDTTIEKS